MPVKHHLLDAKQNRQNVTQTKSVLKMVKSSREAGVPEQHLLSSLPVGWLSKKAIGNRMTLASRLACKRRDALKEPNTSSRARPPCTTRDTRPRVK